MERIHIICGICGKRNDFIFKISFNTDSKKNEIFLVCKNCSSLTGLDEIIKEEK